MLRISSIIKLIRPLNILLGLLTSFVVSYIIDSTHLYRFFDLSIVLVCYMIAGNILNDLMDIEIDKINKPHRFFVQYQINKMIIAIVVIILLLIGSWFALKLEPLAQYVALLFALPLLISNEVIFKKMPLIGNIIISLLVASVFIYTEAGLTGEVKITWKIFILAFMLNLIREIIKDIHDMKGDSTYNFKTLPILVGISKTILLLRILSSIFFIISIHPIYIYEYSWHYIPLILITIHLPLLYIMWRLRVNITSKECDNFSKLLKLMIINGIIIILLSS